MALPLLVFSTSFLSDEALTMNTDQISRSQLIDRLNEDLAREYQAIIAYVIYSQVLKGAEYMAIARELEKHAGEELSHALKISKHIDYLGGMPTTKVMTVKSSDDPRVMLRADLENETETIRNYRERIQQCELLQEYAIAEDIREILRQEQDHQIDLATALGENVPGVEERHESQKGNAKR
jgi:bacterioferritin